MRLGHKQLTGRGVNSNLQRYELKRIKPLKRTKSHVKLYIVSMYHMISEHELIAADQQCLYD